MNNQKAAEAVKMLAAQNKKITFAESCTGGLAAATLVSVPDASNVFDCSFVTYSEEMKIALVGVDASVIEKYGVVSEETAREMAAGCAKRVGCDVGVGITGFAGPSGGTETTPVGTVCFGFYIDGKVSSFTEKFGNIGRNEVREKSVEFVFSTLCDLFG